VAVENLSQSIPVRQPAISPTGGKKTLSQNIRIRASLIRKRLVGRNSGEMFREILASLTDQELCEKEDRHHEETIQWRTQNRNSSAEGIIQI
jgi:hypothetical protein